MNALEDVRYVVRSLAPIQDREAVSRVDLCVDFTPDRPFELFSPEMWVTRAERIAPYLKRGELTGWSIGQGGELSARLYDKICEIFDKNHKAHWFELWRGRGWEAGDDVWRLEFQFRRSVLLELGAPTLLETIVGNWAWIASSRIRALETIARRKRGGMNAMRTLVLQEAAAFLKLHPEELRRRAKLGQCRCESWPRLVFLEDDLVGHLRSLYPHPRQACK